MIKKLPVDFNLYSLPPLPQDDWFLVWILKTNGSFQVRPSSLTISYSVFAASDGMKSMMNEWWGNEGIQVKQFVCIIMPQRISNMKRQKTSWKNQKKYNFPKPTWDPDIEWVLWFWRCVCELDCVLTSKYEATAAFWLSSSSHVMIITVWYLLIH